MSNPGAASAGLRPFSAWDGPRQPRIVLVGEAWGTTEAMLRLPFAGQSGMELWRMLGEAAGPQAFGEAHARACAAMRYEAAWVRSRGEWMEAQGLAFTNVFNLQPAGNKIESLCETKKTNRKADPAWQLARAQYLKAEHWPHVERLAAELEAARPNLIVALGNTACWALLRATNIGSIRGGITAGSAAGVAPGRKVLPTYHPAGVLRQWSWRPIVVADLMKAWRQAGFAEVRRPQRLVTINPSLAELEAYVATLEAHPPPRLSVDIETGQNQIKCIGFAANRAQAFVVPFVDLEHSSGSYWGSPSEERKAWACVARLLALPSAKVFQNGVYDLQYITQLGMLPRACTEDTMLLHHSLYPELPKGLGFLGSIYTEEPAWKLMRKQKAAEAMTKADE